jgi:hypothetical protein
MLGYYTKSVEVETEVDIKIEDVLRDVPTEELQAYIDKRFESAFFRGGNKSEPDSLVSEAYDRICEGDLAMAKLTLEQYLFPKFKTLADCAARLKSKSP